LLAAFPERVNQVDGLVCAGGFHMILEGRFDLAGVFIAPPPLAGNAYTLVEYPLAHPAAGVKYSAIVDCIT
jgi:hypothetical protein